MNGFTWAILKLNKRTVYSAITDKSGKKLLDIKESVREVIVEKNVEVVPSIDQTFESDKAIVQILIRPRIK